MVTMNAVAESGGFAQSGSEFGAAALWDEVEDAKSGFWDVHSADMPFARLLQGATWLYEAVVSPALKHAGAEARKVPALQKALDKLDAFTVSVRAPCTLRQCNNATQCFT